MPEISEALVLAEETAYTEGELNSYESYWDSVRTEKTLLLGRFEEGKLEGRIEGKIEGKLEGKIEIAINMKKAHKPIEEISLFTGLSLEEIKKLS